MNRPELMLCAPDEETLVAQGKRLAAVQKTGLVVYLEGDLGMGKTTFTRGFIQGLGHSGSVKSPTYTLVEPYAFGDFTVYHFDLFRLGDSEELEFMGIRDYFGEDSTCLIEWPGRGKGVLPPADLVITIEPEGSGRRIHMAAITGLGETVVLRLSKVKSPDL